ncbi:MAG TPA: sigma-70 family RNA polymerase sigma factor [Solirubrobacterales bacterium]|jgi:RNA polymerase sigma-70 factor (ECF subfamily)|nr:sigma-70 family RNA polymerase sigma factor [Solirubrobacterales bacterium]
MTSQATGSTPRERELLAAARGGDEGAFERLVDPYRGELHAHCYRMLGSVHDAEDALQESMLRAWRGLPGFEGRSSLRSWLYRIATNASLTMIEKRPKRVLPIDYGPAADPHEGPGEPLVESVWVEPYADDRFGVEDGLAGPEARYEQREGVELAFVAALQNLPANQRAVLILREVLGFSAKEAAETLDTTTASVNSALQRARAAVEERLPDQSQQETARALGDDALREIVDDYVEAWQRSDVEAVVEMLTEDAAFSMPPLRTWFSGRGEIATFLAGWPLSGRWRWHPVYVRANGQPALAFYSWDPDEEAYMPFALNVLTLRGQRISDVTAFIIRNPESSDREVIARMPEQPTDPERLETAFRAFGLPDRIEDNDG